MKEFDKSFIDNEHQLAEDLELQTGVSFSHLPEDFYPGMPYISLRSLIESGAIKYSYAYATRIIKEKNIPSHNIDGRLIMLSPKGVSQLIDLGINHHGRGRKPGSRFRLITSL